jgi:hypothetical protein
MNETHFALKEDEYREMVQKGDLKIDSYEYLQKRTDSWTEIKNDIDFDFENEYKWIQLVLVKEK